MTKLEKFLLTYSSEMINSESTVSRYFKINNISIRLSDHVSLKSTSDIQIITPTNKIESGLYTVLFGDTGKVLIWNLKQLKDFLPSMMLMKEMTTKTIIKPDSSKSKSVVEKIELCKQLTEAPLIFDKKVETKIKFKFAAAAHRTILVKPKSIWNAQEIRHLSSMLSQEFGRGDSVNEDFQIFLNCTSVDYNDVINLYKIIVIDNNKVPSIYLLQEAYNLIK